jgi:hypothetical protein
MKKKHHPIPPNIDPRIVTHCHEEARKCGRPNLISIRVFVGRVRCTLGFS